MPDLDRAVDPEPRARLALGLRAEREILRPPPVPAMLSFWTVSNHGCETFAKIPLRHIAQPIPMPFTSMVFFATTASFTDCGRKSSGPFAGFP